MLPLIQDGIIISSIPSTQTVLPTLQDFPLPLVQKPPLKQGKGKKRLQRSKNKSKQKPQRFIPKSSKKNRKILLEIKRLQRTTDLLIPRLPFLRISSAIEALREITESFIVMLFENSNLCTVHAKRATLLPADMHLVQSICRGMGSWENLTRTNN
ncbi:hypothetical protein FPOA_12729 [Fusarium poae]|uniref:Core Histone H2A/H2B/H3 domain-containing protein n=1 Tax=Fusarium poae TaxID=36050 RepID=A0A1B8A7Z6_FUSPO|nr:hypothetical protein FPOA_12764 [Fusarium poae]OBS16627.1 hypothetical protein FPOA_12760 [Fusarium poae]OBS16698.1 hypothetical protein FPOA_12729 [Fusarium poae]